MEQLNYGAPKYTKRKAKNNKGQPRAKKPHHTQSTRIEDPITYMPSGQENPDSSMSIETHQCVRTIAPITISDKSTWKRVFQQFDQNEIYAHIRSSKAGIVLQADDFNTQRKLISLLNQENVGFHCESELKVMIRGLPVELDCQSIFEDLRSQLIPVREVHRICHPTLEYPYKLVLVILDHSFLGRLIYKVQYICSISNLTFEAPRNLGQCRRCHIPDSDYSDRANQDSRYETTIAAGTSSMTYQETVTETQSSIAIQYPVAVEALQKNYGDPRASSKKIQENATSTKATSDMDFYSKAFSYSQDLLKFLNSDEFEELQVFMEKIKCNRLNRIAALAEHKDLLDCLNAILLQKNILDKLKNSRST